MLVGVLVSACSFGIMADLAARVGQDRRRARRAGVGPTYLTFKSITCNPNRTLAYREALGPLMAESERGTAHASSSCDIANLTAFGGQSRPTSRLGKRMRRVGKGSSGLPIRTSERKGRESPRSRCATPSRDMIPAGEERFCIEQRAYPCGDKCGR